MTSQCLIWDCRCNRDFYTDIEDFKKCWTGIIKHFAAQIEQGKGGYEHWQFRIALIKKKRKNELMDLILHTGEKVPNYLEPTTTGEAGKKMGDAFYQLKNDSRIAGPWTDKDVEKYIPRHLRNITPYAWQREVLESGEVFDDRIVNCIIDPKGCHGKSTLTRYAMLNYKAIKLPNHNDPVKLTQSTCNMLSARKERHPTHVFVDLPRAMCKEKLHGLYIAIEEIKGGYVCDERNHFDEWWYDPPSIWVFSNTAPDTSLLTRDRWRLWEISPGLTLVPLQTSRGRTLLAQRCAHAARAKIEKQAEQLIWSQYDDHEGEWTQEMQAQLELIISQY